MYFNQALRPSTTTTTTSLPLNMKHRSTPHCLRLVTQSLVTLVMEKPLPPFSSLLSPLKLIDPFNKPIIKTLVTQGGNSGLYEKIPAWVFSFHCCRKSGSRWNSSPEGGSDRLCHCSFNKHTKRELPLTANHNDFFFFESTTLFVICRGKIALGLLTYLITVSIYQSIHKKDQLVKLIKIKSDFYKNLFEEAEMTQVL